MYAHSRGTYLTQQMWGGWQNHPYTLIVFPSTRFDPSHSTLQLWCGSLPLWFLVDTSFVAWNLQTMSYPTLYCWSRPRGLWVKNVEYSHGQTTLYQTFRDRKFWGISQFTMGTIGLKTKWGMPSYEKLSLTTKKLFGVHVSRVKCPQTTLKK